MKFASMLTRLRNTQEGTESTPSSPYCPQPGTEPPWLTKAKQYLVDNDYSDAGGQYPTREFFDPRTRKKPDTDSWDRIKGWAATVQGIGVDELDFNASKQGWCAAFAGAMLAECRLEHSGNNLASSYKEWGQECESGEIVGAIAVFNGHVGFVSSTGMVLGGNQSDGVHIQPQSWYGPVLSYRWPSECPCPGEANGQNSP